MNFREFLNESKQYQYDKKNKVLTVKDVDDADELESILDDYGIEWEQGRYGYGSFNIFPKDSKELKDAEFLVKRHVS